MTNFLKKIFVLFLAVAYASLGMSQTHSDGLAAMQMENWDKAIKIYSDLTQKDPADQVAWLTLGSAYLAKGDKNKAKETYDAAFNAKAEGALAMIATARILLLQNKQAEADAIFKKADKLAKKDIAAKRLIGESFLYMAPDNGQRPNYTRAEEALKAAMEASSKDFPTLMALGYCYKEMPNGGLAAQHYEYAANVEPQNPLPVYMLAVVYKAAKLNDKFLVYIDKTLALNPKFTPALRSKAEFLYYNRQWEKATEAAKNLVNNGTDITLEDEMLLANLLYITKDCPGCSALVEKILKKDGTKNYLRRLQGYCDYDNGNYAEGLKILEEFFKIVAPEKILASDYDYLGKLQVKMGRDTNIAIANFMKAIDLDSSKWPLYGDIGDLYKAKKDYCNAAVAYRSRLDSVATPAAMDFYWMGICHYYCQSDSMRFEKAEKAFARVTEIAPDAGIGWSWRAKAMSKLEPDIVNHPELLDEFGKAKPFFEEFVKLGEKNPEKNKKDLITAYEYLASYFFLRKEDDNAKLYLDKLVALDPENKSAKDIKQFMAGETPVPPTKSGGKGK